MLRFFRHHHWMLARRHYRCSGVPWTRTCRVARATVKRHQGLLERVQAHLYDPTIVRAWVLRYHPCLDAIIQLEDRTYDPTISNGGGHGDTSIAYGIPQADPGYKMASAGPDWRTNPYTQLRWMIGYTVGKFGSECAARDARLNAGMY